MSTAVSPPPIDLSQLARYTGGDAQLDAEVLEMFARQSASAIDRLATLLVSPDGKTWYEMAHTLKGSSLSVGAAGLAEAAARAENLDLGLHPLEAEEALRALKAHFRLVAGFIESHLSR